jgi:inner membrane protein
MLAALLVAPWLDPGSRSRFRLGLAGVGLSAVYVIWSFVAKAVVDARFARSLEAEGVVTQRWMSAPMPMTTLYWRCVVDEGDRFRIAHLSILDPDGPIGWRTVERRADLVGDLLGTRGLDALRWFSGDYWVARRDGDRVVVADLRFGDVHAGRQAPAGAGPGWVFEFELVDGGRDVRMLPTEFVDVGGAIAHLVRRSFGGQ